MPAARPACCLDSKFPYAGLHIKKACQNLRFHSDRLFDFQTIVYIPSRPLTMPAVIIITIMILSTILIAPIISAALK